MIYEKKNEYINSKTSIEYIIKILEKGNYKMTDTFTSFPLLDSIYVNTLLSIYEKIELKAFQYLTEQIKMDEMKIDEKSKDKIIEYFKNDKLLLKDEKLTNGFKKYILRYYLGDNGNNLLEYMAKNFNDIFNKIDIWGNSAIKDDRLNKEKESLISINKDDNCIIKFYCNKLFSNNKEEDKEKVDEKQDEEPAVNVGGGAWDIEVE